MWQTLAQYYCIDWVALVLNAAAIYLLGKKRKSGFALGVVANLAWIVFRILAHSVATVVACSIFIALNAKGWWNWSTESTPEPAAGGPSPLP
jgi:hypothetical protein